MTNTTQNVTPAFACPGIHDLETTSGLYVSISDPNPETIKLTDIARGLARTCRFGGHTRRFYSVAEHVLLVAEHLAARGMPAGVVMAGLHHDDAEAYLGDIPQPLKPLLGETYADLTDRMDAAISAALGTPSRPLPDDVEQAVKESDLWALSLEAKYLLPSAGRGWAVNGLRLVDGCGVERRGPHLGSFPADDAWARYVELHMDLIAGSRP